MADISQEVEQLRNAEYGEEVRSAFISCMEKIHEENESYNNIKTEVAKSAATMKQQVEAINTKSAEVQKALQDLTTAISNGKPSRQLWRPPQRTGKPSRQTLKTSRNRQKPSRLRPRLPQRTEKARKRHYRKL